MRTLLAYQHKGAGDRLPPRRAAERLARIFEPVLEGEVASTARQTPHLALAAIHLPVCNWRPPYAETRSESWVEAVEYPLDAASRLARAGKRGAQDGILMPLVEALAEDPVHWTSVLAPPYALVSHDGRTGVSTIVNDGLGQAQLFVYEDDEIWAVTNRIFALRALGIPLEPDPLEWASRFALGWFPLTMTGFRGVRLLEGGTTIRVDGHGVHESRRDVLAGWVCDVGMPDEERLELAATSLERMIRGLDGLWEDPCAGLSGGWDSRAVVSAMHAAGTRFRVRVKGPPDSQDVRLAHRLARLLDLDLTHLPDAEQPATSADDTRHSIRTALIWSAGHTDTTKHKSEFSRGARIAAKDLNVMGQHGELARASFYGPSLCEQDIPRALPPGDRVADVYTEVFHGLRPPAIRSELDLPVREVIHRSLHRAGDYDIPGFGWIDFFYLYECTRRRSAGSLGSQGSLVVAPFMNVDFIRACFAGTGLPLHEDAIHRHIIARNTPEWAPVPFTKKGDNIRTGEVEADELSQEDAEFYHLHGSLYYDAVEFWEAAGAEVLAAVQDTGGFWTEVFDPERTRAAPRAVADELTMLMELPLAIRATALSNIG